MLKEKLLNDLKDSMKEKDIVKKNTVQFIRACVLQYEKDNGIEADDNKIIEVIAKESKKRKDGMADLERSGREDLIEQNNRELEILLGYLPEQLSVEEVEKKVSEIIKEVGASSMKDMGNVMKQAKEVLGASADGKTISEVVKKLLS